LKLVRQRLESESGLKRSYALLALEKEAIKG
jgi:hypothetical protein